MAQGRHKLLDYFFLVLAGIACSVLAWLFWRLVGDKGFYVLNFIVVVGTLVDNARLRRRIGQLENQLSQSSEDL